MTAREPVDVPDQKEDRTRVTRRRIAFRAWVAASSVIALAIGFLAPAAEYFGNAERWVALLVPAMAFLLLLGVGWLAYYVVTRPDRR